MVKYLPGGFFLSFLLCVSVYTYAQKENNIFYFGHEMGLDFNSGKPRLIKGALSSSEAAASICDESGRLLFYSDGNTVWNRAHQEMPRGKKILGGGIWPNGQIGNSATQGVVIVRSLQDRNQYYLFTLNSYERVKGSYPGYLRYSIIDMRLQDGMGDVVSSKKNIILDTACSEKMIVTQGEGCYYWLVTRKIHSPYFYCYKIDDKGIAKKPVISKSSIAADRYWGEMKVAPNGKFIAAIYTQFTPPGAWLEFNYFDKKTGKITRSEVMETFSTLNSMKSYGLEFSGNSTMLYAFMGDLFQYNLAFLPNIQDIARRKVWLGRFPISGMRMAPDHKIYISAHYKGELAAIREPDKQGTACGLDWHAIQLPERGQFPFKFKFYGYGLGSVTQIIRPTDTIINPAAVIIVGKKPSVKLTAPAGFRNYLWRNGSSDRTLECTSTSKQWVYSYEGCSVRIDTFNVQVN
jgi:hypothetical protein